ncbi:hypothetical protein BH10CYA1_BH10CYA1_19650 [soil metagenome]
MKNSSNTFEFATKTKNQKSPIMTKFACRVVLTAIAFFFYFTSGFHHQLVFVGNAWTAVAFGVLFAGASALLDFEVFVLIKKLLYCGYSFFHIRVLRALIPLVAVAILIAIFAASFPQHFSLSDFSCAVNSALLVAAINSLTVQTAHNAFLLTADEF